MKLVPAVAAALLLSGGVSSAAVDPLEAVRVDPRLAARGDVALARTRLKTVLAQLSERTGVTLKAEAAIAEDRVTCLVRNRSAGETLADISRVMQYLCKKEGDGYRVRLHPAVAQMVQDSVKATERAEGDARDARRAAVLESIEALAAGKGEQSALSADAPGLVQALRRLSPEQRQALADAATEPIGVIGTHTMDHLSGRVFGLQPLSSYPQDLQDSLREKLGGSPGLLAQFGGQSDPLVGIVAHDGSIGLAFSAGSDLGILRPVPVGGPAAGAAAQQAEDARLAVRNRIQRMEEADPLWLDPAAVPLPPAATQSWPNKPVRVAELAQSRDQRAAALLEKFFQATGVSVIADQYTLSSFVYVSTPEPPASGPVSAAVWARRLGVLFKRRYRADRGVLLLRCREPIQERIAEVPGALEDRLVAARKSHGRLELNDLAETAVELRTPQLRTLNSLYTADNLDFRADALNIEWRAGLLRFLARASEGKPLAASGSVAREALQGRLLAQFNRLYCTGTPAAKAAGPAQHQPVSWRTEQDTVIVSFLDTASGARTEHRIQLGPKLLPPPASVK